MAQRLVFVLLVCYTHLDNCKVQVSKGQERMDTSNERSDFRDVKFRNVEPNRQSVKYTTDSSKYHHLHHYRDTSNKKPTKATRLRHASHFGVQQKEDIYNQYLQNTLRKYLNSIGDLKTRIQSILRHLKYSAKNKWCDVFKLSKVIHLLQKLQKVLQVYNQKQYNRGNGNLQKVSYTEKRVKVKNGGGVQKGVCKSLEIESKEIIDFVNELLTLLDDAGLKSRKPLLPSGVVGRETTFTDNIHRKDSRKGLKTKDGEEGKTDKTPNKKSKDLMKQFWYKRTDGMADKKQGSSKRRGRIIQETNRRQGSITKQNNGRKERINEGTYKSSVTGQMKWRQGSDSGSIMVGGSDTRKESIVRDSGRRQGSMVGGSDRRTEIVKGEPYKSSVIKQTAWKPRIMYGRNDWSSSSIVREDNNRRGSAGNNRQEGSDREHGKTQSMSRKITQTAGIGSKSHNKHMFGESSRNNKGKVYTKIIGFKMNKDHENTSSRSSINSPTPGTSKPAKFMNKGDKNDTLSDRLHSTSEFHPPTTTNGNRTLQESVTDNNRTYQEPVSVGNRTYQEALTDENRMYLEPITDGNNINDSSNEGPTTGSRFQQYSSHHEDISDLYDEMVRESQNISVTSEPRLVSDIQELAESNKSKLSSAMDQNASNSSLIITYHRETERRALNSRSHYVSLNHTEYLSHCSKCEKKENEAVCGRNGQTYPTLCHAINCGKLSLDDVTFGDCNSKNVCADSLCKANEVCVPLSHATCLSLYPSPHVQLPCQLYICSSIEKCQKRVYDVCGMNGETYSSMCKLHEAGQSLAYTGSCRPSECTSDPVCGVDMNTYPSICHAQARHISVNHKGKCFQRISDKSDLSSCAKTRELRLCRKLLCRDVVLPAEQCCPICGGAVTIGLNATYMKQFIANKDRNHLYVIEDLLQKLLSKRMTSKCSLYCYLTTTGEVSVIMEAVNAADHHTCHQGLVNLEDLVEKAALRSKSVTTYRILQPGTWAVGKKFSFHHGILEPVNYLEYQVPGGIDKTYLDFNRYHIASTLVVESDYYLLLMVYTMVTLLASL